MWRLRPKLYKSPDIAGEGLFIFLSDIAGEGLFIFLFAMEKVGFVKHGLMEALEVLS